jgi:hypothetical protein
VRYTAPMRRTDLCRLLVVGILLLATRVHGIAIDPNGSDRDYKVIVERNPFGLKPPPPPPTNNVAPVAPKDEILLTGITSIGMPKAYFMTVTKAPQKQPEFYSLGVDEQKNGLEVIDINPSAKSVRVRNGGIESVMTFASNGVKPPATPAGPAPGLPGVAAPGAMVLPGGGNMPGGFVAPGSVTPPAMGATPGGANPAGTGRIRTIPSRNVRTPQASFTPGGDQIPASTRPDPNAPLQDALMMELQKRANPNIQFPPTPIPP